MFNKNPSVIIASIFFTLALVVGTNSASAFEVTVTYSNLTVDGPISLGILPEDFPEEVDVVFEVAGVGTSPSLCGIGTSPGIVVCEEKDIQSALVALGNLSLNVNQLEDMEMEFTQVTRIGDFEVTGLNYNFFAVDTATATNVYVSNSSFQLSITGHDEGSGMDFTYTWADSEQVITGSSGAAINIKPGSDPNSINTCSGGTTTVAIFGSGSFDVEAIDQDQLVLASALVRTVGKSDRSLCSIEDVGVPASSEVFFDGYDPNPDGHADLVCHFMTQNLVEDASSEAELQIVGCEDPNDVDGCQAGDTGYSITSGKDKVNIVNDCN